MNPRTRTVIVIWTAVIGLLGYDLFTLEHDGTDTTISAVIITATKDWPMIAVGFGILVGHLFFQMNGKK